VSHEYEGLTHKFPLIFSLSTSQTRHGVADLQLYRIRLKRRLLSYFKRALFYTLVLYGRASTQIWYWRLSEYSMAVHQKERLLICSHVTNIDSESRLWSWLWFSKKTRKRRGICSTSSVTWLNRSCAWHVIDTVYSAASVKHTVKPALTKEIKQKHLDFCLKYRNFDWRNVI
jgi:hypothetical protein